MPIANGLPMNALRVLREAAYFYSHNFLRIAQLCLPLLLLERLSELALREQFGHWPEGALQLLFGVLFYPLYTSMLILFLEARSQGREVTAAELFGRALQLWPGFALLTALSSVLIMLGMSLMLLPGMILIVLLAFAEYLLVLRGQSPLDAMRGSIRLVRGQFLPLAGCIFSALIPLWLLGAWLAERYSAELAADVLSGSLSGLLQLFVSVVVFRYFMLLEQRPQLEPRDH